jgi:hypothetical protein
MFYMLNAYIILFRASMKVEVGRFKDGKLMVKVVFEPNSNFRKETLSWVPTFEEIDRISKTLKSIDVINQKDGQVCLTKSNQV